MCVNDDDDDPGVVFPYNKKGQRLPTNGITSVAHIIKADHRPMEK
jgi:hypothetical protein